MQLLGENNAADSREDYDRIAETWTSSEGWYSIGSSLNLLSHGEQAMVTASLFHLIEAVDNMGF